MGEAIKNKIRQDMRAKWERWTVEFIQHVRKTSAQKLKEANGIGGDTAESLRFERNLDIAVMSFHGSNKYFPELKECFEELPFEQFARLINIMTESATGERGFEPVDIFKQWDRERKTDSTFRALPLEWQISLFSKRMVSE